MDLTAGPGKYPHSVARALVLIHQDLRVGLRLSDIAQQVGLSPFHFSRVFTKAVGQPPHAYLTEKRVAYAKELLEHSDFTVGEIARRTGYPRQPHFTQVFKDRVGMAPGIYRNFKRGEKEDRMFANTINSGTSKPSINPAKPTQ
jgi:AraC family transcriptional regulator